MTTRQKIGLTIIVLSFLVLVGKIQQIDQNVFCKTNSHYCAAERLVKPYGLRLGGDK